MKPCLVFNGERKSKKYGSNDKKLSLLPYFYCRLFLHLCLKATPLFPGTKKSRPSADVCQDLAIYGVFRYAHRSQYCINPKHLCSQMVSSEVGCNNSTIISRMCLGVRNWPFCPACTRTNRPAYPDRQCHAHTGHPTL